MKQHLHLPRRRFLALSLAVAASPAWAAPRDELAQRILVTWHRLVLELVRHTATYSPPVASRAFGYLGVTSHEALVAGNPGLVSLAGQVNGLSPAPQPSGDTDPATALHYALSAATKVLFGNTGPTGQRAHAALTDQLGAQVADGLDPALHARSAAHGTAIAEHILAWAATDGGATIDNMGFPRDYTPGTRPQDWVPTSLVRQQQAPLLPAWGQNRLFVMPSVTACGPAAPPAYDETPGSEFHATALEVYEISRNLTDEQKLIARFWSDDPMLSSTPAGHWISILLDIADRDGLSAEVTAGVLAKLGIAQADAFIACWAAKFEFNLLRPVTYIRRVIDPAWEPLLITPPFPEFPSGHSTQSGAAATVLTAIFGENFAFEDTSHEDDGFDPRGFSSFHAASEEAAMSRLYGGIHFRFGNQAGLEQGRCIGAFAAALRTEA
ncbi:MAG: phosphoesterase PA-phosphatase [Rhodobacter sp.]|nr:phosphoesterase PA-phosphatase [Rhodobacter sp.]